MTDDEIDRIIKRSVEQVFDAGEERHKHYLALIEKHEHLLYGNGKEGLTTVIDRLERAVDGAQGLLRDVIKVVVIAAVIGALYAAFQFGFF